MVRNLLLISNSKTKEQPNFLGYCQREVQEHFGSIERVLFIPYAEPSAIDGLILAERTDEYQSSIPTSRERRDAYTKLIRSRFEGMGYELLGIHETSDPVKAVEAAQGIFCGGGNTYDLWRGMEENYLIKPLQRRIAEGMPVS